MSEKNVNENGDELDRYCGYILNSQSDEGMVHSQHPLDLGWELSRDVSTVGVPPLHPPYWPLPLDHVSEPVPPLRSVSHFALQPLDPLFGLDVSDDHFSARNSNSK